MNLLVSEFGLNAGSSRTSPMVRTWAAMKVLIVEDEVALAEGLRDGLNAEGYEVTLAHDGDTGFTFGSDPSFDAIVLDIMLPNRNGYKVCRDLRAAGIGTPVIMLTAKDGELDEAEALDIGADDFLRKPFSFVVLEARLRAMHRRSGGPSDSPMPGSGADHLRIGDVTVELRSRRCHRGATEIVLTSREIDLLVALMRKAGSIATKADLLSEVWGADFDGDPNIIEVYIGYLRRKIDVPFGKTSIHTVRGHGYRMDP
jgi:two-component system, OmpR family, response regulator